MTPKQRIKAILAERFPEATEVPQAGVSPFPPATPQTATVPVMITRRMEDALRNCGFSQERINKMTPSEAWEILQTEARRIAAELARLHRDGAIASKSAHDPDAVFYARLLRDFGATYTGRERVKAPARGNPIPMAGSPSKRLEPMPSAAPGCPATGVLTGSETTGPPDVHQIPHNGAAAVVATSRCKPTPQAKPARPSSTCFPVPW